MLVQGNKKEGCKEYNEINGCSSITVFLYCGI